MKELIKKIRTCLNMSQAELAELLNISFATVNRWENGHAAPNKLAQSTLYELCKTNNVPVYDMVLDKIKEETAAVKTDAGRVLLYHGSKSGIQGMIEPKSRSKCDFGKGFYMGTEKTQPLTLICNYQTAKIYTLEFDMTDLNVLNIGVDINWALFVAYNRGKMESARGTALYNRISKMADGYDVIAGFIANDRMFIVLDRFFNGEITDTALINSLSALKLGKQYVAVTKKACKKIKIISENTLSEHDKELLKTQSEHNRQDGIALAEEMCRKYRRDGKYFDEILKDGE